MVRFLLLLGLTGLLAGCAAGDQLAVAHGKLFALNPGLWSPTPSQLAAPPQVPQS